ncbi:DUF6262 family protein [Priestia aryabhattai]|uniref:DUF6262 family protein n=1 Tax=Priestia aryabhattai TaxID=412384 RepID=UPI002E1FCAEE|nr:DUF6262 family protein [Priestia aryabhattai]
MKDRIRNTDGLTQHAKKRTNDALEQVELTLQKLYQAGEEITKYKVFKESNVSRNFIYTNEIVANLVKEFQDKPPISYPSKSNLDLKIQYLQDKLAQMESQIKESQKIREENEKLSKAYETLKTEYTQLEKQFQIVCDSKGLI